ncbi:unnamed protein product [Laminaria digitata]
MFPIKPPPRPPPLPLMPCENATVTEKSRRLQKNRDRFVQKTCDSYRKLLTITKISRALLNTHDRYRNLTTVSENSRPLQKSHGRYRANRQRWVSTKSSISQLTFFNFINKEHSRPLRSNHSRPFLPFENLRPIQRTRDRCR